MGNKKGGGRVAKFKKIKAFDPEARGGKKRTNTLDLPEHQENDHSMCQKQKDLFSLMSGYKETENAAGGSSAYKQVAADEKKRKREASKTSKGNEETAADRRKRRKNHRENMYAMNKESKHFIATEAKKATKTFQKKQE
jgi:hypothetical protein